MEFSLGSRSFLGRLNDQVRKRHDLRWMLQKTVKSILGYGEFSCLQHCKHLCSWERITQNRRLHNETIVRHLQDWCLNKMRSMEWRQLFGKILHGNLCLCLVINKSSLFSAQWSTFIQMYVLCFVKIHENTQSNTAWEDRVAWLKSSPRDFDRIDGAPMEFEWNIFPGFNTLQLSQKITVEIRWDTWEFFQEGISSCRCSTTSHGIKRQWKRMRIECPARLSLFARRFGAWQCSFLGPGSQKTWYSISADSPQGEWDRIAEKMMLEFGESRHPVFRATSPLSRGILKCKGRGKLSLHFAADEFTIETFSHTYFCKSAQSLRSSRRNVWRKRILSRGKICC